MGGWARPLLEPQYPGVRNVILETYYSESILNHIRKQLESRHRKPPLAAKRRLEYVMTIYAQFAIILR